MLLLFIQGNLTIWYLQVYSGLQSQVGLVNQVADGFSWMLLKCIHDDQKFLSAQWFALKAVCNTKLAVALTIMEECFLSMLDPRTGIHMIPQVLYNWGLVPLPYDKFFSLVCFYACLNNPPIPRTIFQCLIVWVFFLFRFDLKSFISM